MESNIKIKTSGGHDVELRSFITGRQARYIQDAFLEEVTLTGGAEGAKPSFSMSGTKANVAQDRALESVVVSVDGKTENVVSLVLDLPATDSAEVVAKVGEITGEKKSELNTATT